MDRRCLVLIFSRTRSHGSDKILTVSKLINRAETILRAHSSLRRRGEHIALRLLLINCIWINLPTNAVLYYKLLQRRGVLPNLSAPRRSPRPSYARRRNRQPLYRTINHFQARKCCPNFLPHDVPQQLFLLEGGPDSRYIVLEAIPRLGSAAQIFYHTTVFNPFFSSKADLTDAVWY